MANILIVDDSSTMRKIISRSLRQAGLPVDEIFEAGDGIEGLGVIASGKTINLILSDINMPNMDGITFVKEAKKIAAYKFTPIIMLTTESQENKKLEAQAAGAKAWIVKPFQPGQVLAAVSKLILS